MPLPTHKTSPSTIWNGLSRPKDTPLLPPPLVGWRPCVLHMFENADLELKFGKPRWKRFGLDMCLTSWSLVSCWFLFGGKNIYFQLQSKMAVLQGSRSPSSNRSWTYTEFHPREKKGTDLENQTPGHAHVKPTILSLELPKLRFDSGDLKKKIGTCVAFPEREKIIIHPPAIIEEKVHPYAIHGFQNIWVPPSLDRTQLSRWWRLKMMSSPPPSKRLGGFPF